jgi:Rad3-related DNA helicase
MWEVMYELKGSLL